MLRTRITVIVSLSFTILSAALILESWTRRQAAEERYASAIVTGDRNAWQGIATAEARRLEAQIPSITRSDAVVQAVARRDGQGLAEGLEQIRRWLGASAPSAEAVTIEVATLGGEILYSTAPAAEPGVPGVLSLELVRAAAARTPEFAGLIRTATGAYRIAAVEPVYARGGVSGFVAMHLPVHTLLDELAATIGAEVAILAPEGTLVTGADAVGVEAIAGQTESGDPIDQLRYLRADGRIYARTSLTMTDALERPIGKLLTVRDVTQRYDRDLLVSGLSYGAVAAALLLLISFLHWYLRTAFRPLNGVIRVLHALARGDRSVTFELPPRADEIGRLANTVDAFRRNQAAFQEMQASQERMASELAIARQIQLNIVPSTFPAFPERSDFQLHAVMEPAKAVGGDLYDFFLIDEQRLFFLIGDVSDKGVPAALFMAIVRTLFKTTMLTSDLSLERAMVAVNRFLVDNNPSQMFVTIFAGVLDTRTGQIEYCDGGHEAPFIRRAGGGVEQLQKKIGLALGFHAGFEYRSSKLQLWPGDALVLYTDGVNEAMNQEDAMFTTEQIGTVLAEIEGDAPPERVTAKILHGVHSFAGQAPQSDDIAVLAIQYVGRGAQSAETGVAA